MHLFTDSKLSTEFTPMQAEKGCHISASSEVTSMCWKSSQVSFKPTLMGLIPQIRGMVIFFSNWLLEFCCCCS